MSNGDSITIVSCGTMRNALERLKDEGLLDGIDLVFTDVCLKERPWELERQLKEKLHEAGNRSDTLLVVYGNRCFYDSVNPERDVDKLLHEEPSARCDRIKEHSCVEMMVSEGCKADVSKGKKVYWIMPPWIENRDDVYYEWDLGKRNQTFPQNDVAMVLDSSGFFNDLMENDPEKILEFSDWMGVPMDAVEITLDRFRDLLKERIEKLRTKG